MSSLVHRHDFGRNRPHGTDDPTSSNTTERPGQYQPCDSLCEDKQDNRKGDGAFSLALDAPHKSEPREKMNMLV
jgi:hypothetical protein